MCVLAGNPNTSIIIIVQAENPNIRSVLCEGRVHTSLELKQVK